MHALKSVSRCRQYPLHSVGLPIQRHLEDENDKIKALAETILHNNNKKKPIIGIDIQRLKEQYQQLLDRLYPGKHLHLDRPPQRAD